MFSPALFTIDVGAEMELRVEVDIVTKLGVVNDLGDIELAQCAFCDWWLKTLCVVCWKSGLWGGRG
jgi:hypothetical protein